MSRTEGRVLILGGGVIGLGIGWQLAQRGREVLVLEREVAGAGASGAAAGMLAATAEVTYEEEALLTLNHLSASLYADFARELEAASGLDIDYRTDGTLVVGLDRDDGESLKRLLAYQKSKGLAATMLSGEEAREMEPGLAPGVHSAVWCAHDHQVDPVRLVAALAEALRRGGGVVREHAPVRELWVEQGRARGAILEDGERVEADEVVVCTGAWTRRLQGVARGVLPHVRPVRGQMLALQMEPEVLCTRVIRAPDAYLVPKSDGRLIIGATMEERGFDARHTAGGLFELLRGAWEAMPGTYDLPLVNTWVGFRPITLHNEPVLGPSPEVQNLWLATGHGRNGILLTAVTALLMSEAIARGALPEALRPFAP